MTITLEGNPDTLLAALWLLRKELQSATDDKDYKEAGQLLEQIKGQLKGKANGN